MTLLAAFPLGSEIASEMLVPAVNGGAKEPAQLQCDATQKERENEREGLTENSGDEDTEESQLEKS